MGLVEIVKSAVASQATRMEVVSVNLPGQQRVQNFYEQAKPLEFSGGRLRQQTASKVDILGFDGMIGLMVLVKGAINGRWWKFCDRNTAEAFGYHTFHLNAAYNVTILRTVLTGRVTDLHRFKNAYVRTFLFDNDSSIATFISQSEQQPAALIFANNSAMETLRGNS